MSRESRLAVYAWNAWHGYLISRIFPRATLVEGNLVEDCASVLSQLTGVETHFIFQVNLTLTKEVPASRCKIMSTLESHGVRVLNQDITDISKHWLQAGLRRLGLPTTSAGKIGPPKELLIVKSNENYMGVPERALSEEHKQLFSMTDPSPLFEGGGKYLILERQEIPNEHFEMPCLSIERFIQSPDDSFFRIYKVSEILVIVKAHAKGPLKKIRGDKRDLNIITTVEEVAEGWPDIPIRLSLVLQWFLLNIAFDYGCVDVVSDGVEYYITDINTTPWGGAIPTEGHLLDLLRNEMFRMG
jgi:hypothetical protein